MSPVHRCTVPAARNTKRTDGCVRAEPSAFLTDGTVQPAYTRIDLAPLSNWALLVDGNPKTFAETSVDPQDLGLSFVELDFGQDVPMERIVVRNRETCGNRAVGRPLLNEMHNVFQRGKNRKNLVLGVFRRKKTSNPKNFSLLRSELGE